LDGFRVIKRVRDLSKKALPVCKAISSSNVGLKGSTINIAYQPGRAPGIFTRYWIMAALHGIGFSYPDTGFKKLYPM